MEEIIENVEKKKKYWKYVFAMLVCALPIVIYYLANIFIGNAGSFFLAVTYGTRWLNINAYISLMDIWPFVLSILMILFAVLYICLMVFPLMVAIRSKEFRFRSNRFALLLAGGTAVGYFSFNFIKLIISYIVTALINLLYDRWDASFLFQRFFEILGNSVSNVCVFFSFAVGVFFAVLMLHRVIVVADRGKRK